MIRSDFRGRRVAGKSAAALTLSILVSCGGAAGQPGAAGSAPVGDEFWGPLAVAAPSVGADDALIEGTLQLTEECVLLDERGDSVLLVWPADRTRWHPESGTVSFTATGGEVVTLADGDPVGFGGGGSSVAEDGRSAEDFVAAVDWVAEPDPTCVTETRWFIGEVTDPPSAP